MSKRWLNRALIISGAIVATISISSIIQLSKDEPSSDQLLPLNATSTISNHNGTNNNETQKELTIGWSAWADAEIISLIVKKLLEAHFDLDVKRVMADIGIQYESVARGDIDLMLMAWLPNTHSDYWKKVRARVVNLGRMYTGRLGLVVPNYVPVEDVASIKDLGIPKIANLFKNKVQGIDPGSGLMEGSKKAVKLYSLKDLKLIEASSAAMTAVLDRAIRDNQWIVVTSWTPHWMFARYQLRFLKDPKNVFGGIEGIHAIARKGLDQDHPKVVDFLSRFQIPDDQIAELLFAAQKTSPEQAVVNYLEANPNRVDYWINGTIAE